MAKVIKKQAPKFLKPLGHIENNPFVIKLFAGYFIGNCKPFSAFCPAV